MEDYKARRKALYKGTYKKDKSKRDLHQATPSWKMKGTTSQVVKQVHLKKATWTTSRSKEGKPSSLQEESKFTTTQTLSSKYMSPSEHTSVSLCKESNKLVGTTTCPKSNGLDAKSMDATKGVVLNLRRTTTTRGKGKKLVQLKKWKKTTRSKRRKILLWLSRPLCLKSSFKGGRGLIGGPIYGIQERMIYMREQMKQERLNQSRRTIK